MTGGRVSSTLHTTRVDKVSFDKKLCQIFIPETVNFKSVVHPRKVRKNEVKPKKKFHPRKKGIQDKMFKNIFKRIASLRQAEH